MGLLDYQRTVIGFHGSDNDLIQQVLLGERGLDTSKNPHDWLGEGIYFWEHGPHRAYEWAKWRARHGGPGAKIKKPAVIGAFIQLGNCCDLLDTRTTSLLGEIYPMYKKSCEETGINLPKNEPASKFDLDATKRNLDCAVINWIVDLVKKETGQPYQTVRGIFTEGEPVFPGSYIMMKSHIQIAVRDPSVIVGYFKPNIDFHSQ